MQVEAASPGHARRDPWQPSAWTATVGALPIDKELALRILQVTLPDISWTGGVQRHTLEISRALAAAGHEVTVASPRTGLETRLPAVPSNVQLLTFPSVGPHPYSLSPRFLRYVSSSSDRHDVVHTQNFHVVPLLVTALRHHGDLVVTPHYHRTDVLAQDRLQPLFRAVKRRALRTAGAVACVSDSEADLVAADFDLARASIAVVPNVVAPVVRAPGSAGDSGGDGPVVLAVGRLVPYKRVDRTIAAMAHLVGHRLVVLGTGPEEGRLRAQVEDLGLGERVQVRGRVDDDELAQWLHRADVVVSMSRLEAFGRVVYDALAHGARVVCSDITAFREVAARFPDAVTLVADEAAPRQLAEAVRSAASQGPVDVDLSAFSPSSVAAALEGLYTSTRARSRL